jgi:hypothetical protein
VANTGDLCGDSACTIASNPSGYSLSGALDTTSTTSMRVYFTATTTTAVLAWGGHIASQIDWGIGLSAGAVNGASYHMYFSDLTCSDMNCNVGQKDRSMSTNAVTVPGSITIEKVASIDGPTAFGFLATPAPLTSFELVDDGALGDPDPTPAVRVFDGITTFTTYTVTESPISMWTLTNVACSTQAANGGSQSVSDRTVTIDLREGELVTCVFSNARDPQPAIALVKTAEPGTYSETGDVITYSYTIANTGDTNLGPTQFTVSDDRIDAGAPFACGAATMTLAIGESFTCSHDYTITSADLTAASVTNTATAQVGQVSSAPDTATVTFVAPPTTTTTTTTIPVTTTTVTPTTIVQQEVTTTVPVTTIPVTTTPGTTTTVVDTCITIPREPTDSTPASTTVVVSIQGDDPCLPTTTVPGTIVLTQATTTSPTVQPMGTTTKLPSTGGNTEPSGRTIALIIVIGTTLLLVSRRQVRQGIANRNPS